MANETPHHEYMEITDAPSDNPGCPWLISGCLFVLSIPFMIFTIIAFIFDWSVAKWILILIFVLIFVWALLERLSFCKLPDKLDKSLKRPSPRLLEAQRAKKFLGFDFGQDFRLRTTGSHDYAEILLDFNESNFISLKSFCENSNESSQRVDSDDEIIITDIKKFIVLDDGCGYIGKTPTTKSGFTKVESYYDPKLSEDGNLWITSKLQLEVDYECRTLKMSWTGW